MTPKKYFLAIVIPEPLFSEIEAIKQNLFEEHHLKGALRSPAHITLHRPFEWKEERESELIQKVSDFKFSVPFPLQIKNFAFFEPRVIYADVLKNELLYQLHAELTLYAKKELKLFNESEDMRGFHPHITVAFRDLKKPKFYELQKTFESKKLEGTLEYTGFSLLKLEKRWEEIKYFKL
ncbi:2'-5' RNA ligase [Sphingobacteriaceae bacterium]|nr:2'-5' RNA ligase [Sphingobacteriaceae bacterium]